MHRYTEEIRNAPDEIILEFVDTIIDNRHLPQTIKEVKAAWRIKPAICLLHEKGDVIGFCRKLVAG